MSLRGLQKAAVSPDLFRSHLAKAATYELESVSESPQGNETNEPSNHGPVEVCTVACVAYGDTFLIPGGRFLLFHFDTSLTLYDLGIPHIHPIQSPSVISQDSLPREHYCFRYSKLCVTHVDTALVRIAINCTKTRMEYDDIRVENPGLVLSNLPQLDNQFRVLVYSSHLLQGIYLRH